MMSDDTQTPSTDPVESNIPASADPVSVPAPENPSPETPEPAPPPPVVTDTPVPVDPVDHTAEMRGIANEVVDAAMANVRAEIESLIDGKIAAYAQSIEDTFPAVGSVLGDMKDWLRKEIELHGTGVDHNERSLQNP